MPLRLCDANNAVIFRLDGDVLHQVASYGGIPTTSHPSEGLRTSRDTVSGRAICDRRTIHVHDLAAESSEYPVGSRHAKQDGHRTTLATPLLREGTPIGAILIRRMEVRPFSNKQIALLETFAHQAVIAIENARLLSELRELLQQQTATADVLKVISRSTFDLQTVLDTLAQSAVNLCEADQAVIRRRVGDSYPVAATCGLTQQQREHLERYSPKPGRGSVFGRALVEGRTVHIPDVAADPEWERADQPRLTGIRAAVGVPLLREGVIVGTLVVVRTEPRAFSQKQIELLETFADQAVIALENVRLFDEVQKRTDDLSESLEQQTATSEVLKVISSSPGELEPVFNAILENATRICEAKFANLFLYADNSFRIAAQQNPPAAYAERWRKNPVLAVSDNPRNPLTRLAMTKRVVNITDLMTEQGYVERDPRFVGLVEFAGARTHLLVPMLKDGELAGAIAIYRQEVWPFTDKQIELVQNFAAQAVIAIENTRLLSELRESLQQQTATADVLKVISSSPGQLEPVFNAMLENAVKICGAKFGMLYRSEDDSSFRTVAMHDVPRAFSDRRGRNPVVFPPAGTPLGRIMRTRQVAHIADIRTEPGYADSPPFKDLADLGGARTLVAVPMLKDNELVGAIVIYRQQVRPFSDKQIELVKNFAAQAVIAIENTRLLNELRHRTEDLSESLEQQTATSQVLQVISSSPGEIEGVFHSILDNAVRICGARFGNLALFDGTNMRVAAMHNAPPEFEKVRRENPIIPSEGSALGTLVRTRKKLHIIDLAAEESYATSPLITAAGARSMVAVPMLKENELVGAINIYRQEVRSFSEKQIALLENFAAQAVIAIENARLLNELRQRTDDLFEALEQQTATSEVLKVISSSPGELQPVFEAMLENAVRICGAKFGTLFRYDGDIVHLAAQFGTPPALTEFQQKRGPFRSETARTGILGRVIRTKVVVHSADSAADPNPGVATTLGGARSIVGVPMFKNDALVGAIVIYRQEVRPFTDKQIELVKNFAAQAVIAIENTRLLKELRQRTNDLSELLEQQTATSEVLGVISRSTGDLAPVFASILGNATRICEANFGGLFLSEGVGFRSVAQQGPLLDWWKQDPLLDVRRHPGLPLSRIARSKSVVHVADLAAEVASHADDPRFVALVKTAGARTVLGVPMLKDDGLVGAIIIYRSDVRPFSDKQIELVQNFASQAIIAIENARLLNELRQSTAELTKSLENLRTTQDRLVQTQKLASLGQLTAGIAHEIKNPLNFVNNFSGVSAELIDELQEALGDVSLNEKRRGEITELMDTLRGNLDKVVQHGKRADAIVKNMLLHSREGAGEHRVVDINAIVEESLNLAYHGARAEKQGFNITLQRSLDPAAGEVDVFPQDITRVLLNLISNGFYAATKRRAETNGGDYEPTLAAGTKNLGDRVEITIRDNGIGISPDVKEKMFNPFFTTKPAGEGTGLGLSISHDIIVKQHGGSIEVETQPGEFTELRIILPRAAVFLAESGGRV